MQASLCCWNPLDAFDQHAYKSSTNVAESSCPLPATSCVATVGAIVLYVTRSDSQPLQWTSVGHFGVGAVLLGWLHIVAFNSFKDKCSPASVTPSRSMIYVIALGVLHLSSPWHTIFAASDVSLSADARFLVLCLGALFKFLWYKAVASEVTRKTLESHEKLGLACVYFGDTLALFPSILIAMIGFGLYRLADFIAPTGSGWFAAWHPVLRAPGIQVGVAYHAAPQGSKVICGHYQVPFL